MRLWALRTRFGETVLCAHRRSNGRSVYDPIETDDAMLFSSVPSFSMDVRIGSLAKFLPAANIFAMVSNTLEDAITQLDPHPMYSDESNDQRPRKGLGRMQCRGRYAREILIAVSVLLNLITPEFKATARAVVVQARAGASPSLHTPPVFSTVGCVGRCSRSSCPVLVHFAAATVCFLCVASHVPSVVRKNLLLLRC